MILIIMSEQNEACSPSPASLTSSTFFTYPKDPQTVALWDKTVSCGQLLLKLLDTRVHCFHVRTTLHTHEVIMMLMPVMMFVTRRSIPEINFTRQTGLDKQLERPVHRGDTDSRTLLAHLLMELGRGNMALNAEKNP